MDHEEKEPVAFVRYDVAVSFAGPDRPYVLDVVSALKAQGVSVFYDDDAQAELWGADLFVKLDEVYRHDASFVIMFVSRHYVDRTWTQHERVSAQARALIEDRPYLLPIRLDDTDVPGLRPSTGFLDARRIGIDGIVRAFKSKLGVKEDTNDSSSPDIIPLSAEASTALIKSHPPGWEYLLYAGEVSQQFATLEPRFRDLEIRYSPPNGLALTSSSECVQAARNHLSRASTVIASVVNVIAPEAQTAAFGETRQSGNPIRIAHLAQRLATVCEDFLNLIDEIRGTSVRPEFSPVFDTLARIIEVPVEQMRAFVPIIVAQISRIPAHMASPDPKELLVLEMSLLLTLPDDLVDELSVRISQAIANADD
jgi:hypothetical protein